MKFLFFTPLLFCFFYPFTSPANLKQPEEVEEKILRHIDENLLPYGLPFLKQTVEINSGTGNKMGVQQVAELYQSRLKALNFKTSWVNLEAINRGPHLFAEHQGSQQGPRILIIGHSDTVFEQDSPFQKYEALENSQVRGPGAYDMKGGNLVFLQALEALHQVGELEKMNVIVAIMSDEERPGEDADGTFTTTRKDLIDAAKRSDIALNFELASESINLGTIALRGISEWQLKVVSKGGHSSQIFTKKKGPGAIYPVSRILARFYDEVRGERYLTFNAGRISGGSAVERAASEGKTVVQGKLNVIPTVAEVLGDLRYLTANQLMRAKEKMRRIAEDELKRFRREYPSALDGEFVTVEITFKDLYPPVSPTPNNKRLLGFLSQISEQLDMGKLEPLDPSLRGTNDTAFVAPHVPACLAGLGPMGSGAHSVNEILDVSSLPIATKRAALLMRRLANNPQWKRPK